MRMQVFFPELVKSIAFVLKLSIFAKLFDCYSDHDFQKFTPRQQFVFIVFF